MADNHFSDLAALIAAADTDGLLVQPSGLTGYSGDKLIGTLQRFARYHSSYSSVCYLEIGVFQGLTLVSVAAAAQDIAAFGIDNFAQFDPQGKNAGLVERRIARSGATNAHLINADYEDALEYLDNHIGQRKVGVYFVDGPHDYRSQFMCLELVRPFLAENAVIVVDDSNYRHVRQANRDFLLVNPEYKLLFEAYTRCHPKNASPAELEEMSRGWWNGVNILVRDPANVLASEYPPTLRDRTLYENGHIIHAAKHGYVSAPATLMASALLRLRFLQAIRQLRSTIRLRRQARPSMIGTYATMNTFSDNLPTARMNTAITSSSEASRL